MPMSDSDLVDGFEEKPSRDDAPDTCQYRGCDDRPEKAIRFRDPQEYLCYCWGHATDVYDDHSDAKYRTRLR